MKSLDHDWSLERVKKWLTLILIRLRHVPLRSGLIASLVSLSVFISVNLLTVSDIPDIRSHSGLSLHLVLCVQIDFQ